MFCPFCLLREASAGRLVARFVSICRPWEERNFRRRVDALNPLTFNFRVDFCRFSGSIFDDKRDRGAGHQGADWLV
jgi:hypothetical protein